MKVAVAQEARKVLKQDAGGETSDFGKMKIKAQKRQR